MVHGQSIILQRQKLGLLAAESSKWKIRWMLFKHGIAREQEKANQAIGRNYINFQKNFGQHWVRKGVHSPSIRTNGTTFYKHARHSITGGDLPITIPHVQAYPDHLLGENLSKGPLFTDMMRDAIYEP